MICECEHAYFDVHLEARGQFCGSVFFFSFYIGSGARSSGLWVSAFPLHRLSSLCGHCLTGPNQTDVCLVYLRDLGPPSFSGLRLTCFHFGELPARLLVFSDHCEWSGAIFVLPLPLAAWIEGERPLCWQWAACPPCFCCLAAVRVHLKSRDLSHSLSPAAYVSLFVGLQEITDVKVFL